MFFALSLTHWLKLYPLLFAVFAVGGALAVYVFYKVIRSWLHDKKLAALAEEQKFKSKLPRFP